MVCVMPLYLELGSLRGGTDDGVKTVQRHLPNGRMKHGVSSMKVSRYKDGGEGSKWKEKGE